MCLRRRGASGCPRSKRLCQAANFRPSQKPKWIVSGRRQGSSSNKLHIHVEVWLHTNHGEKTEVSRGLHSNYETLLPRRDRLDFDQVLAEVPVVAFGVGAAQNHAELLGDEALSNSPPETRRLPGP